MLYITAVQRVQKAYDFGGIREIAARIYFKTRHIFTINRLVSRTHKLSVGDDVVKVHVRRGETINLAGWRPDWKTKIICGMLELQGGAFLDIGANVGQTLLDYRTAKTRIRYFGFEPGRKCIEQVMRLIDDNLFDDCSLIPVALSNRNSICALYRGTGNAADPGATLIDGLRPERHTRPDFVPCYRLDYIWGDLDFEGGIGVIKIDVEGSELMVLEGMTSIINAHRPWILCEVLDRDAAADADLHRERNERLFDFVQGHGYKIMRVEKSQDQLTICGLVSVSRFPTRAWCAASSAECDYLFIPHDQLTATKRLFGKSV